MESRFIGIIPARYDSSRFPGKPLEKIKELPMVVMVWQKCRRVLDNVFIATDDQRIMDTAESFGANAILNGKKHISGTDRVAEAARALINQRNEANTVVVNIQGDEPLITSGAIISVCEAFKDPAVKIATLIHAAGDDDEISNPNRVKVVRDFKDDAITFSRKPIPWNEQIKHQDKSKTFQHIGIYGFRADVLQDLCLLKPSEREMKEKLEQLRWLDNGYSIKCVETDYPGIGVDSPEDLLRVEEILKNS